jgi:LacI family transcriptional regulator
VGLVVPTLVHPFFAEVAKGISACLSAQHYSLIISSSEENAEMERSEIDQMVARGVDAIILASTEVEVVSCVKLRERRIPFVLLDRQVPGFPANFVGIDDVTAGLLATNHLIDIGCKTIAHIAGTEISTALGRRAGYAAALTKHGLNLPQEYIVQYGQWDDVGDKTGYGAMKQLLALNPRPDGVFCCNDPLAMGAMRAILEAGLEIPRDVAVIGCGNLYYDDLLRVPLSSVDHEARRLGETAAQLALNIVKKREPMIPKTILLPATLVVRASTQR